MARVGDYRETLRTLDDDWVSFLLSESRLPGPRANLELLDAVADQGTTDRFLLFLRTAPPHTDADPRAEFLAACGAAGLGESIARGDATLWPALRRAASDPRWRVREGVAMGLQRIGDRDMDRLLDRMRDWATGSPLERRALVAGLCEPRLLTRPTHARAVLELLDAVTASVEREPDRRADGVRALRKALGYGWSVAVVADPESGRRRLERWAGAGDADIRWIVRENLRKNRLRKLDPSWVAALTSRLAAPGGGPGRR